MKLFHFIIILFIIFIEKNYKKNKIKKLSFNYITLQMEIASH